MNKAYKRKYTTRWSLCPAVLILFLAGSSGISAAEDVSYCGNGSVEWPNASGVYEQCDGSDRCSPDCRLITTEAVCGWEDLIIAGDNLDFIDIGNIVSETGHSLTGWSDANMPGIYGGCEEGNVCSYRQAWEPPCLEANRIASFLLSVPRGHYATSLELFWLDGLNDDSSFNIRVNGTRLFHFTDEGSHIIEWQSTVIPLDNAVGTIIVSVEAVSPFSRACKTYGQLTFTRASIRGYACRDEPAGSISGCVYRDGGEPGVIDGSETTLSGLNVNLEICHPEEPEEGTGPDSGTLPGILVCTPYFSVITGPDGCYDFIGLPDGRYLVSQEPGEEWVLTYPERSADKNILVDTGQAVDGVDFALYPRDELSIISECGNGVTEFGEECDGIGGVGEDEICTADCRLIPAGEDVIVLGAQAQPNLAVGQLIINGNYINPGETASRIYKLIVANNGEIAASGVLVTDHLPEGFSFSGTGKTDKSWFLGDIEPGDIKSITYMVDAADLIAPGIYVNTAEVFAENHTAITTSVSLEVRTVEVLGIESGGSADTDRDKTDEMTDSGRKNAITSGDGEIAYNYDTSPGVSLTDLSREISSYISWDSELAETGNDREGGILLFEFILLLLFLYRLTKIKLGMTIDKY